MDIDLKIATEDDSKGWDDIVHSSPHGTIFHTWKWLKIVERHRGCTFYPLIAYRDTSLYAIYPIFLQKKGIFRIALSPPSHAYLLYLGPVIIDYEKKKQDKKESIFIELQREVDKFIFERMKCRYSRIRLSPGLNDSRPLQWNNYTVTPLYTLRTGLGIGKEQILERFDRKLRVSLNRAIKEGVVVREGKREDLLLVEENLTRRRKDQSLPSTDHVGYLLDLYDHFHDNMKIFLAYHQDELVGSLVALVYRDIMHLWIGTPKSELKGVYPNDLVQWEAMKWACDHQLTYFESMDAGDDLRLRAYKSKWNPDPLIWFSAEKYSSPLFRIGERLFMKK